MDRLDPRDAMVALGAMIIAVVTLVSIVSKRRDWICIVLAATGLGVLAISGAIYHHDDPRFGLSASISPAGPILWTSLAALLLALKLLDLRNADSPSYGAAFSLAFLVWIMVTIAAAMMMLLVRHGVTAKYDEVVALGILTLGQTQLGFAGVLDKGLAGSIVGRLAWWYSVIVGIVCFAISCIVSVFYFLLPGGYAT